MQIDWLVIFQKRELYSKPMVNTGALAEEAIHVPPMAPLVFLVLKQW
jgi:hypothetical protein